VRQGKEVAAFFERKFLNREALGHLLSIYIEGSPFMSRG
jgi:hypothetical protein